MGADSRKVFISYAHEDGDFARTFAKDLQAGGSSVWMDTRIAVGQPWDEEIETQLSASDRVVVILSPASVTSQTVRDEISYALDRGKEIYPVMYRTCDVPLRLKRHQYLDARSGTYRIADLFRVAGLKRLRSPIAAMLLSVAIGVAITVAAIVYFNAVEMPLSPPVILWILIASSGLTEGFRRLFRKIRNRK